MGRCGAAIQAGALSAACLVPAPSSAAGEDTLLLEPTSRWEIDYAAESCALRRTFARDGVTADLEILQQAPGPYFRVTVTSATLGPSRAEAKVRFEPDSRPQVPAYLVAEQLGERHSVEFTDSLQQNVLGSSRPFVGWRESTRDQREKSITALSIEEGFDRNVALATGEMHEPMEALRVCMSDLYGSWGVDLEAHENLAEPLRAQNGAQIARQVRHLVPDVYLRTDTDLPAVARAVVGSDGRVKRCHVDLADWPEQVSAGICDLVTREARFLPARDRNGRPIASYQAILIER
jgi:hypothetical protein